MCLEEHMRGVASGTEDGMVGGSMFDAGGVYWNERFEWMRRFAGKYGGVLLEWYEGSYGMLRGDVMRRSKTGKVWVLLKVERRCLDADGTDGRRGLVMHICKSKDVMDGLMRGADTYEKMMTYLEMTGGLHETRSDEFVLLKVGNLNKKRWTTETTETTGSNVRNALGGGQLGQYMNYEIPLERTLVGPTHVMELDGLNEQCQICMEELRGELCVPTTGDGLGMDGMMVLPCCGRLMHSRCISRCCGEELAEDYDGTVDDGSNGNSNGVTCVNMTQNIMGWGRGEWMVCMMCRAVMFPMTEVGASEGYIRALGE